MRELYYGDNLDVLRQYIPTESVDLIYLDPPFNSKRAYNLLFETPEERGARPRNGGEYSLTCYVRTWVEIKQEWWLEMDSREKAKVERGVFQAARAAPTGKCRIRSETS